MSMDIKPRSLKANTVVKMIEVVVSSMCTFPVIYGALAFSFEKDARYGGDCSSLSPLS